MINYDEELKKTNKFSATITKEKELIQELQLSQHNFKNYINLYIEEISIELADNEVFKNMLLASLDSASLQTEINLTDLNNLNSILDITSSQMIPSYENIEQYNKLFSKVERNINITREILQKIINSFEQFFIISNKSITSSPEKQALLAEAKKAIMETDKKEDAQKNISRNIKEIEDNSSSDLLCFFPKSENDILAISTVQDTYKVMFTKEDATICIEDDNFNFTLKTSGVQISNAETVLLISREDDGYFVITNMPIDVPSYTNVSRIDRNKNFIELEINNPTLSIFVTQNKIEFLDKIDEDDENNSSEKNSKTISVSPSNDEPLPKELASVQSQSTHQIPQKAPHQLQSNQAALNQTFGQPHHEPSTSSQPSAAQTVPVQHSHTVQAVSAQPTPSSPAETIDANDTGKIDFIKDNDTLFISEKDNQVILPYKLSEVEKQYEKNGKKKYSSVQDLIQNEYIIPTENFKNPIKSRFREAYHLIKKKEHGHLKEALELGFELMFQSNLNPAVIAACKNLKELDIYLDCLDDNELDKFSCFNIVYNVPPSTSTGKSKK